MLPGGSGQNGECQAVRPGLKGTGRRTGRRTRGGSQADQNDRVRRPGQGGGRIIRDEVAQAEAERRRRETDRLKMPKADPIGLPVVSP